MWALVTMTTVGYGDLFPVRTPGRIFAGVPAMVVGVSTLGYILPLFASTIQETRLKSYKGMGTLDFVNHAVVCTFPGIATMLQIVNESDKATCDERIVLVENMFDEFPQELRELGLRFERGVSWRKAV